VTEDTRSNTPIAAGLLLGGLLLAASMAASTVAGADESLALKTAALVAAGIIGIALLAVDPAWSLGGAVALSVFSGHWGDIGSPLPLDRLLFMVGVVALALRLPLDVREWKIPKLRAVDYALIGAGIYVLISSWQAGTIRSPKTYYELIDSHGFEPWAYFLLAPFAFRTTHQRRILFACLTLCGAYLGYTAIVEGMKADAFVWPAYIADPNIITHADRARGPFIEAGAMGLALCGCAAAALVLAASPIRPVFRVLCVVVAAMCAIGVIFTLTRAIWLGAAAALVGTLLIVPRLRRYLPFAAVGAVIAVGAAFALVPSLGQDIDRRENDNVSVWSRLNSNAAAVRMFQEKPVFGWGWDSFAEKSPSYYRMSPKYPLNGVGDLHEVFLSKAVELGVLGGGLWLLAVMLAIAAGVKGLRGATPEHLGPKVACIAFAIAWVVDANFTPLTYPFPNILLWLFAGVAITPVLAARPQKELV
jgi:O-antigen ligase